MTELEIKYQQVIEMVHKIQDILGAAHCDIFVKENTFCIGKKKDLYILIREYEE